MDALFLTRKVARARRRPRGHRARNVPNLLTAGAAGWIANRNVALMQLGTRDAQLERIGMCNVLRLGGRVFDCCLQESGNDEYVGRLGAEVGLVTN